MFNLKTMCAVVAGSVMSTASLYAAPITVTNPDFTTNLNGWTTVINNTANWGGAGTESGAAYISSGNNYIYQTLGALQPNTEYTLTVSGRAKANSTTANPIKYSIILANGTTLASETTLASQEVSWTGGSAWQTFQDYTITFTTGSTVSGNLTIILANTSTPSVYSIYQVNFDNVRLEATPVPEAASLGSLVAGSFVLLTRRK